MPKLIDKGRFFELVSVFYNEKKYDSYLDALSDFVEIHNIELSNIDNFINDKFRAILKKEAQEKNLLKGIRKKKKLN